MATIQEFQVQSTASGSANAMGGLMPQFYEARVVKNLLDNYPMGWVKVFIPSLHTGAIEDNSGQGTVCRPIVAGSFVGNSENSMDKTGVTDCGTMIVPEVGSHVMVFTPTGDINNGNLYYLGGISPEKGDGSPSESNISKKEDAHKRFTIFKTPEKGKTLVMSDGDKDSSIVIRGSYNKRSKKREDKGDIRDPTDSQSIQIWEGNGDWYIKSDDGAKNTITIFKNGNIEIRHHSGHHIIMSDGNITMKSHQGASIVMDNNITMKAANIYLN